MNERFFGPDLYRLYQDVKRTFDPGNLLNPGNVVDAPPVGEKLRYSDGYEFIPLETKLDFSAEMGFDRAVEMCSGMGICRKKTTGTMCPSFMATREEEHSTRGRANALRAALSGRLPTEEFTSRRMYEVMDLCIECKACKAECPSNVDMAKIKFEFLAQYHEANGTPLRARLFGDIPRQSRLASGRPAPAVNALLRARPVRAAMKRVFGISRHRTLPPFARAPFTDWFARRQDRIQWISEPSAARRSVQRYLQYLQPPPRLDRRHRSAGGGGLRGCATGPLLLRTSDDLQGARRAKRALRRRIRSRTCYAFAEQGLPIVGLEPSCLLSLRDEYAYLLPGDPRVPIIADRAVLFEEFIADLADRGELDLRLTDRARRVLLHGHCHQKALVGTKPSHRLLTLPPNYVVEEVDSGCCGMAGSFGYEAEHYDLSIKMADRRLLPAVREAGEDALIAAAGTSCRAQIQHGTGRAAFHPAEILRGALAVPSS